MSFLEADNALLKIAIFTEHKDVIRRGGVDTTMKSVINSYDFEMALIPGK